MIRKINFQDRVEVGRLLQIQQACYQVEARLIGFDDVPPLAISFENVRERGEIFYGYFKDRVLAGAISYLYSGGVLDINRLMVAPEHFRTGIAKALLQFIHTVEDNIRAITVTTSTKNEPAVKLYEQFGFVKTGEKEIALGISMTHFKKQID